MANAQVCASARVCSRVHVCASAALRMGGVVGGSQGRKLTSHYGTGTFWLGPTAQKKKGALAPSSFTTSSGGKSLHTYCYKKDMRLPDKIVSARLKSENNSGTERSKQVTGNFTYNI
jgi:hypothetical protein